MIGAAVQDPVERRVHVGQGDHYVSSDPDVVLTTVLGSCVALCLRDPEAGVGGMNHFLLPEGAGTDAGAGRRYGAYLMEVLINDVLKAGGRRDRLEAKLFGGGRMFDALTDIGAANAAFAERFMADEGIAVVGGSLRGAGGRRLHYWPVSGRARQRAVTDQAALPSSTPRTPPLASAGDLELF
ncbi:chemoreceptor glutamine deamidase CheD family protein [Brevundimonas diminuta 470-4]|nr:chemoreceptor glutamine deamidase CheD family protein [Brevundimonas diminuta 470-4]